MTSHYRFGFGFLLLILSSISCSLSVNTGAADRESTAKAYAEQTRAAIAVVATVPAATLIPPTTAPLPSPTTEPAPALFNHPLYYLMKDSSGTTQLYRMEVDGITKNPVIGLPGGITDYDINLVTGAIAFIAENDLFILNPGDSTPLKILDEIPLDDREDFYVKHTISFPRWSHDGTRLAFYHQGLVIYWPATGETKTIRKNQFDENDFMFVRELYSPELWSPDDSKLLINITYYESGSAAIYHFNSDQLITLTKGDQSSAMGSSAWTEDSTQVYIAGYSYGGESSDMWMFDANTGAPFEYIPVHAPENRYHLAQFPCIHEGNVYFFYELLNTYPQSEQTARMAVSSKAIPAQPAFLRTDSQYLVDVLWAEDASFALGLVRDDSDDYPYYGELIYIPADNLPTRVLLSGVRMPKWGY